MTTEATMRARATDPITSHMAAERTSRFAGSHAVRIVAALQELGTGAAYEIGLLAGLSVEQVCRRLTELERDGKVQVVTESGQVLHDGRYRMWEAV